MPLNNNEWHFAAYGIIDNTPKFFRIQKFKRNIFGKYKHNDDNKSEMTND